MTNGKIGMFGEEDARDGRESCNPLAKQKKRKERKNS
jgi:hypothetical protein